MNKKRLVSLVLSSFVISNLILSTTIVYAENIDVEMHNIESMPILDEVVNKIKMPVHENNSDLLDEETDKSEDYIDENIILDNGRTENEISNIENNTTSVDLVNTKSLSSDTIIDIPDPNLKAVLNKVLNQQATDNITKGQLENLHELPQLFSRNISNLDGLQYCINIEYLTISGNSISDISPLASLTNLKYLDLAANRIHDISPLANLTNLSNLYLDRNQISDISPLANLTNLKYLDLWDNEISDISPLANLTNLKYLGLNMNRISDVSPLANLNTDGVTEVALQTIILPNTIANYRSLEIENKIKNINGEIIDNITVSNNGTYDSTTNLVKWENLESEVNLNYTFSELNGKVLFTGTVTQPYNINNTPTIIATNKVLTVGDIFNPLDGVTANDTEDGEIILNEDNIIVNDVDMSQAGTYTITYKVTDKNGASATKTITITVNPKLEDIKPETDKSIIESTHEVDKIITENNTIKNIPFNKLPNTGSDTESGIYLPLFGVLLMAVSFILILKKKKY